MWCVMIDFLLIKDYNITCLPLFFTELNKKLSEKDTSYENLLKEIQELKNSFAGKEKYKQTENVFKEHEPVIMYL